MEQFAYYGFVLGFAFTAAASLFYIALPLWPRLVYRVAATEAGAVAVASPAPAWLGPAASVSTWLGRRPL